jgi:HKD family nuclease
MASQIGSVSLLRQAPGGPPYLFDRINALLKTSGLERFRASVAYARWGGIGLIAPNIEAVLKTGAEFQVLYGVSNGVTTPDCLLYSIYLQELYSTHTFAGAVEDQFANATFHPKLFEFRFADKTIAVIGSANLTGAGLIRNTEASVEVECKRGSPFEKEIEAAWDSMQAGSKEVTLSLIRDLKRGGNLGSEQQDNESRSEKTGKPSLATGVTVSPKPLFAKVLDLSKPTKKAKILAALDPITSRPNLLYLQILTSETGAQASGGVGYQIQLPVATLAAFFGVSPIEPTLASFRFDDDVFTVNLTHFGNNTHRVRLRPLRDVQRPAIVVFQRAGADEYECSVVPSKNYAKVLAAKCKQQTRLGARKWGME